MARIDELSQRLLKRFKDVPNVTLQDATDWMEWSFMEHGYRLDANVPTANEILVLMYAEADGASQVALRTADFFEWRDGEESVDKSMISDQYRSLSDKLWERYFRKKNEGTGASSTVAYMPRADRPSRSAL